MDASKAEPQGEVVEEITTKHVKNTLVKERKSYVVTAENGLFKNGKQYDTGENIELDSETAGRFMELGEVKNVTN